MRTSADVSATELTTSEYDLTTVQRKRYVHAQVRAVKITPEISEPLLREIRSAVADARTGWLMFEYEIAHRLTENEIFCFLNEVIRTFPGVRIALVTSEPRHLSAQHLGVSIGLDAGQDYAAFTSAAQAERWLLEG